MNWSLVALLLFLALRPSLAVGATWIHLRTPEVDLYTTNSEEQGRELIRVLGSVGSFVHSVPFLQASASEERTPVRIVALSSREEYSPFRLSPAAFGSFVHTRFYNYIVLQDIKPEHRPAAVHEYMHLLFRQAHLALPLWLEEGLADYYSSFESDETQVQVGGVLPSRMRILESRSLLALTNLFAVDHKSPFYKNAGDIAIFYAESWALVHMLIMDPEFAPALPQFIRSMSQGLSAGTAFYQVYGKSVSDIDYALSAYTRTLSRSSVLPKSVSISFQTISVSSWSQQAPTIRLPDDSPGILP